MGWPVYQGLVGNFYFPESTTVNSEATNPLGGFFQFRDLIAQETLGTPSWPNPLDRSQQVPAELPRFMHRRPALEIGIASRDPLLMKDLIRSRCALSRARMW